MSDQVAASKTCATCPYAAKPLEATVQPVPGGGGVALLICHVGPKPEPVTATYWCAQHPERALPTVHSEVVRLSVVNAALKDSLTRVRGHLKRVRTENTHPINSGGIKSYYWDAEALGDAQGECDKALDIQIMTYKDTD